AVGAPLIVDDLALLRVIYDARRAATRRDHVQVLQLVGVRDPFAVGRKPWWVEPTRLGGWLDRAGRATTPGVDDAQLLLAGRIGDVHDGLAIGGVARTVLARRAAARDRQRDAVLDRDREDLAA